MKTNAKVLLGFLLIIILSLAQTAFVFIFQNNILKKASEIKNIQSPLEVMANKGFGYQIMLIEEVHGALIHAQQGQYEDVREHEIEYEKMVESERNLRHDAAVLLTQSDTSSETIVRIKEQLRIIGEFNPRMVELERRGFDAIKKQELESAVSFLIGGNHKTYKAELFQAYENWVSLQNEVALAISEDIQNGSQRIIYLNLGISVGVILMLILVMYVIRLFIEERYKKYKQFGNYIGHILDSVADPIFVKDDNFRFITVNDALCMMLGITREKIIGKTLGESLPKDQMEHFLQVDKMVLESGDRNESEEKLTGKDGKILTIVTKKQDVDENGKKFLVGVIRDITERKQAEEKLKKINAGKIA